MPYIRVNIEEIGSVAKKMKQELAEIDNQMQSAQNSMSSLFQSWKGVDKNATLEKWNDIKSNGSSYEKMRTAISNYADYLEFSKEVYKKAQERAVSRSRLLRW